MTDRATPHAGVPRKFGAFGGVFTPSLLTILGVIMFLRFSTVVGYAGLWSALLILVGAKAISLITGLSVASIATNMRVKGGGAYYLISRSLGVEFDGVIASAALQYSYLPSWLTLMVEPAYSARSARELFMAVYDHWTKLSVAVRPRPYLFGLSLGALNSDLSVDLFDVVADPFQGALWAGPPFNSTTWRSVTQDRVPGSPAWLPRFRDSSIIPFTNQENVLDVPGARWGPILIVYLQYASDPITFFDPRVFYRRPEWLAEPRGPDVSRKFRWFPVVTMLQLAVDMMAGTTAPTCYGHLFAPEHYIHAPTHVTNVQWSAEDVARLKSHLARQ